MARHGEVRRPKSTRKGGTYGAQDSLGDPYQEAALMGVAYLDECVLLSGKPGRKAGLLFSRISQ